MKSFMSIIATHFDRLNVDSRMVHVISHYGQLFLSLLFLIGLFLFYEFFLQVEMAKFIQDLDFRPPEFSPN